MQHKSLNVVVVVAVTVAAACAAYYFVWYLPRLRNAEFDGRNRQRDLDNSRRCGVDGKKFYSDYRRDLESPQSRNWIWFDPETHFSKKLNACLIEVGFNDFNDGRFYVSKSILDVYSGREVLACAVFIREGKEQTGYGSISSKEYSVKKDQLFGE